MVESGNSGPEGEELEGAPPVLPRNEQRERRMVETIEEVGEGLRAEKKNFAER